MCTDEGVARLSNKTRNDARQTRHALPTGASFHRCPFLFASASPILSKRLVTKPSAPVSKGLWLYPLAVSGAAFAALRFIDLAGAPKKAVTDFFGVMSADDASRIETDEVHG